MNPSSTKYDFDAARQRVRTIGISEPDGQCSLADIGESLACYVPRLLRDVTVNQLLWMSHEQLAQHYEFGSWAIGDLVLLLTRLADDYGYVPQPESSDVSSADSESISRHIESDHATPDTLETDGLSSDRTQDGSGHSPSQAAAETNLSDWERDFEECRSVLELPTAHRHLDEPLSEFVEPGDVDLPIGFLRFTVREALDRPFEYWCHRWTTSQPIRVLMSLLKRAVASIRSEPADCESIGAGVNPALRRLNDGVLREVDIDPKTWRRWCEAIRNAKLQQLRLGQIANSLRELPTNLWDQPLNNFINSPLEYLEEVPSVGEKRVALVIEAIRSLGVELLDLPLESAVTLKFVPGPLRHAQDWIEWTLQGRIVPTIEELTTRLLRPLAKQLLHDLTDREAQIAVHRLRLDESPARRTLEEMAAVYGVTRERIRQLEQWGPRVIQVRFPQGRYLLEALHAQLAATPGAHQQASFVHRVASLCFDSQLDPLNASDEVATAWEEAGRLQLTPMTTDQVLEWSRQRLPKFLGNAVFEAIRSQALCLQLDGRPPQWFSRSELDRILFVLHQQRCPVRLPELVLIDKIHHGAESANGDGLDDLNVEDDRSLWARIRRDPRFVECGDHHQLLPMESCGFERLDNQWMVRLSVDGKSNGDGARRLSIESLAKLIVDGMTQRGIYDATTWGVRRFAGELLHKLFRSQLSPAVTAHVLADVLVKMSGGVIRSMRRRRLRWDQEYVGQSVRGKRGWVGQVVTEFGQPLLLNELAQLLRYYFQDYADHVVNQLTTITDEDGDLDDRVRFHSGLGAGIPILVVPANWKLRRTADNVSSGVLGVAHRLARQIQSQRRTLDELDSIDWLKQLVEKAIEDRTYLEQDAEDTPPQEKSEQTTEANMYAIKVTRIGDTKMPRRNPIPAFVLTHGVRADGTLNRQADPVLCECCDGKISAGECYAIEDIKHNGLHLFAFLTDETMRRWCLRCIDYDHVEDSAGKRISAPLASSSAPPKPDRESSVEIQFQNEFRRIVERAAAHRPWSLAELGSTQADVERLIALFEQTTAGDLRRLLSRKSEFAEYSQETVLGAVLLLLETELARRYASEGRLWSAIHQQVNWQKDTDRFLFSSNQPNSRHKSWLETASKELGLRSAFGEDSAQEWYQSIFLQCGFSKRGFESRLAEWLSGQNAPISVHRLLDDARYASSSFQKLWTGLQDFRSGRLERVGLKAILESSPWVLPEWHDSLILQCRRVVTTAAAADAFPTDTASSGAELEQNFLSEPRLRQTDNGLEFVCDVLLTELPEAAEDACDVIIDGEVQSRLLLQEDGSVLTTCHEIALPSGKASAVAELKARSGDLIATQMLELWDDTDEVDGYVVKTGRRISPWKREFAERECLLIYKSDLRIEPPLTPVGSVANGSRKVVRLLPAQTANTRLFLESEVLWEPATPALPPWRDRVQAEPEFRPRESPTHFRVRVAHPTAVVATSLRIQRSLLEFEHQSERESISAWIPIDAEIRETEAIAFRVNLRLGIVKSELRRRVTFRPPGNLWRRGDLWEQIPNRVTSDIRELRQTNLRLRPPDAEVEGQRWQVFEGHRWIASVSERPQRLADVEGWGAPLVLRTGPYNSCQPEQPLLRGLSNSGLIRDVKLSDGAVSAELFLDRRIEPDEAHTLILLDDFGELTPVTIANFEVLRDEPTDSVWRVALPGQPADRRVMAMAIAYNGERLGSWWHADWTEVLRQPTQLSPEAAPDWAARVADAIRWMRLPLLEDSGLPSVRVFAKAFAVSVLTVWLSRKQAHQLTHDAVGEGWMCVVRAIFADWFPTPQEARELDTRLESTLSDGTAMPLKVTTMALCAVHPLLAARFVRAWLSDVTTNGTDVRQSRAAVVALRQQVLGRETLDGLIRRVAQDVARSDEPPDGTLDFVRDSLLMKCLSFFAESDLTSITNVDRSNIEIAMRLDPFRTLVLAECLQRISKELV